MLQNTLSETGVLCSRRRLVLWIAAIALLLGFGTENGFAKCGSASDAAAWKYGSTADLIQWDGRWWSSEPSSAVMQEDTHFDADSKPCSRCGGRPSDHRSAPPTNVPTRGAGPMIVLNEKFGLHDLATLPKATLVPSDHFLAGRTLEVAKRPPKYSL